MAVDWKLLGYSISSVSVVLLGLVAWPGSEGEAWRMPALFAGGTLSIAGMACRYVSHRRDRDAIAFAQRLAREARNESKGASDVDE